MTTKPKTHKAAKSGAAKSSAVARAIARLKAAQAAYDAAEAAGEDATATSLHCEAECTACDELTVTPCANEAEFIEKLRCLLARESLLFGSPFDSRAEFCIIARAVATHFAEAA
jgi:hypothetical protein